MATSCKVAYTFLFNQTLFQFFLTYEGTTALLISKVWKWASGLDCTSGHLISYPHSRTIQSKNSIDVRQPLCSSRTCTLCQVILTEISTQASASLRIFHLRWCLIWLFLSSWISSPWQTQVMISRDAPTLSPPLLLQALWCLIQGQGRPARHSAQTLAPFPQCTVHSSSLLWGLEEITQPGEL